MKLNFEEVVNETEEDPEEIYNRIDEIFKDLQNTFDLPLTKVKRLKWQIEAEKRNFENR